MAINDLMQGGASPQPPADMGVAPTPPSPSSGAAPTSPDMAGDDFTAGNQEATPQEQQEYDQVVRRGVEMVDTSADQIMARVVNSDDPAVAAGDYVSGLVTQMDEQEGGGISDTVIIQASGEILEQLSERLAESVPGYDEDAFGRASLKLVDGLAQYYGMDEDDITELLDIGANTPGIDEMVENEGRIVQTGPLGGPDPNAQLDQQQPQQAQGPAQQPPAQPQPGVM